MKTILCLVLLGLIANSAFAVTASTASATSGSFNSTPIKVFDSGNSTATVNDALITAIAVYSPLIVFGPGADNTTISVWAVKYTASTGVLVGAVKRGLNATNLATGTDSAENSVIAADTAVNLAASVTLRQAPVVSAGPNVLAIAGVVASTNTYIGSMDNLMLYTLSGTSVSQTVTVATAAATTSTTLYTFAVNTLWMEDGYVYVLYESQTQTGTGAAAAAFTSVTASTANTITLQAYGATNGSKLYSTATTVASSLTNTVASPYYQPVTMATGAGNNYSMSTVVQILFKDTTAAIVKFVGVTRSSGAVATAATAVGTDVASGAATAGATYYPGGFFGSNYSYGFAVANVTKANTAATAYSQGIMASLNGTTASATQLAIALGSGTAYTPYITLMGYRYGTGLAAIVSTPASSGNTYSWMTYFANGTVNATTATTIGTFQGMVSQFVDTNGGLWVGYYTYDTTASNQGALTGYIGRLVSQVNYYNATASTKAANVLATFAAILTFVIASLFMF